MDYKISKIISERVCNAGYILRKVILELPGTDPVEWTMAYTPNGDYIGEPRTAYLLCVKRGIQPQKQDSSHSRCSIGFSVKDGKWYGWSHRALYGFKKGSKCEKGDCHYTEERGEWTAENITDAKQMACDFAEGVS